MTRVSDRAAVRGRGRGRGRAAVPGAGAAARPAGAQAGGGDQGAHGRSPVGRRDPGLRAAGAAQGADGGARGHPSAVRDHRGRAAVAGQGPRRERDDRVPARAVAGAVGDVPEGGRSALHLRRPRVRRSRRPAFSSFGLWEKSARDPRVASTSPRSSRSCSPGGIHDGRSSAMVAAMASKLGVARGEGGRADGHGVPLHRRGGQLGRDPACVPADGGRLRGRRPCWRRRRATRRAAWSRRSCRRSVTRRSA